jgi:hypothetical protein
MMITKRSVSSKKDIFKRRYAIRKWMKQKSNGCLEYVGPQRGRSIGNPLISINSGRTTTHLRRWVWEQHHGPLPRGKFIRMRCNNSRCHKPSHMIITNIYPHANSYGPKKNEFIVRCSPEEIRTMRYYRGKVSGEIIAHLMGMKYTSVWSLWRSTCNPKISTLKGWRPSNTFDRRVEDASLSGQNIYLGLQSLHIAKQDIARSRLSPAHKELITRMIQGKKASALAKELKLSHMGVLYVYRRALLSIYGEVGERRWIHLASLGRIHRWKEKSYR